MTIQPGEFWVAEIPFTDGLGSLHSHNVTLSEVLAS